VYRTPNRLIITYKHDTMRMEWLIAMLGDFVLLCYKIEVILQLQRGIRSILKVLYNTRLVLLMLTRFGNTPIYMFS